MGECLFNGCKDVYTTFYDSPMCSYDLRDPISYLHPEAIDKLDDYIIQYTDKKTANGDTPLTSFAQSNRVKLDYALRVSPSGDPDLFNDIIHQSFHLSTDWIKSGNEPSASEVDIMITAVNALIRLSNAGHDDGGHEFLPTYLIYAYLLIRFLVTRTPTTYPLILISIRISQILGLSSLSLKSFEDLNIKSLQWDTFAHVVLTRISTTHPHNVYGARSSEGTYMSPQSALHSAVLLYQRAEDSQTNAIIQGLSNQSYQNADQAIDFSNMLSQSICRKIYYIESQRVKRLTGLGQQTWIPWEDCGFLIRH